jgi:hypothetical protein
LSRFQSSLFFFHHLLEYSIEFFIASYVLTQRLQFQTPKRSQSCWDLRSEVIWL